MNAKRLLEAPIDFQGVPDFLPPGKKRKIERGEHPYADFGSFPRQASPEAYPPGENEPQPGGPIRNYAELLASDQYPKVVRRLARYAGVPANQLRDLVGQPGVIHRLMGQSFARAMRVQQAHRAELEQAAVDIVLGLPEFQLAAEAVQAGELRIIARLVGEVTNDGDMAPQPAEPSEQQQQELEIAQIALELNAEKEKRRMINMMIQGASVNKNEAFHLFADRLNEIDPGLINAFGFLMAFGDFMYWNVPDEVQQNAHRGGDGGRPAGKSRFYIDEDGTPVVDAQAILFPILIHEVVKGLMEYAGYNEDDDAETRDYVNSQVDVLDNEPWDMKLGAPIWRQILRMIGNDNQHLMPLIYRKLVELPPEQFKQRMNALLSGNAEARAWMRQTIQDIQADMQEASPAAAVVARLIG